MDNKNDDWIESRTKNNPLVVDYFCKHGYGAYNHDRTNKVSSAVTNDTTMGTRIERKRKDLKSVQLKLVWMNPALRQEKS